MANPGYLSVRNWDKFQQYKDGRPMLFIRVDVGVLDDYEMDQLTELQQHHLMKIWLLAGRCSNKIINDAKWIARKINAKSKVDINHLVTCGFLELYETVQDRTESYCDSKSLALDKTRKEKTIIEKKREDSASFNQWWEEYPKKKSKKAAIKAWQKADLPELDVLLTVLEDQKLNDEQWQDPRFIPYPASYLNGEQWNDGIQRARPAELTEDQRVGLRQQRTAAILSELNGGDVGNNVQALPSPMDEDEWGDRGRNISELG